MPSLDFLRNEHITLGIEHGMNTDGKMAGGRLVNVGFCEVTARSANKWRRLIGDWLPYVQSQKPKFELVITPLNGCSDSQRFLYTLQYSNGNLHPADELSASQLEPNKTRYYKLVPASLIVTGDTYLVVADRDELRGDRNTPYYQTVYAFSTTSKTTMIGILIALIGIPVALFAIVASIIW